VQTIHLPCTSVWAVTTLPNDDFAVGGSDGIIRIFTKDPNRVASKEILKSFEDQVAAHAIPTNQIGDVDKSKLPGLERLALDGKKDGEVVMVRNGQLVEAHQVLNYLNIFPFSFFFFCSLRVPQIFGVSNLMSFIFLELVASFFEHMD